MASEIEIIEAIEGLERHCRAAPMSGVERAQWIQDWCADLRGFSASQIATACQAWRMGGSHKFPTSGQLVRLIPVEQTRSSAYKPASVDKSWRLPGEDEYRAMSIREKIEFHTVAAHDLRRRAGPMWGGGKPIQADEMPQSWRALRREADEHDARKAELRKRLEQYA